MNILIGETKIVLRYYTDDKDVFGLFYFPRFYLFKFLVETQVNYHIHVPITIGLRKF